VKVTFTCEKCGHEFAIEDVVVSSRDEGGMRAWSVAWDMPCPVCSKLTYGPLTEEMVAEALRLIALDAPITNIGGAQARFVLRLLNEMGPCVSVPGDTRGWLLSLASED
jgi:hypothetical protein